jgi:PAS domain S-box-containing protein
MNRQELFYLLPYLLSLALSLGIFTYTWQHRSVRGARVYSWFVAGQTLTILGFILELISPNLETKLLWDRFQWLTDTFLVILPFLIFCVQFSEYKLRHPRLIWGYWLGIPILFTLVLLTDDLHHLLYPNPHLSVDSPFPELQYDFTFVVYSYALLYVYGANFYGISLLIRRALQPHNAHRLQYWTIAIGFLIPIALSILSLFNLYVAPQRDIAPFSFAVGNLVVAWGLFRYGLFDLVPIARERVLENLTDAVIVLDASNRVVDVNRVALSNIGKKSGQVIGRPVQEALEAWSDLVEPILNSDESTLVISAIVHGEPRTYDLSISPIRDQRKRLIGRVFVAHDITARKMLEDRYRQLSEELERRVRERTEELRESTERYRAVVENQTEFIVRWRPDGRRTFANEAYRRYFGLTPEQAVSAGFMPLVAEEDRTAVEAKVSRLISGEVPSETDIHRVIKADGSIGWQEWVDQAIHDETGQIIEFQSVGRDITERRQAEEELREAEIRYRTLVESTRAIFWRAKPNLEFLYISPQAEQTLGYPLKRWTSEPNFWKEHIHPDDQEMAWTYCLEKIQDMAPHEFEYRMIAANGNIVWVRDIVRVIVENNKPKEAIGVIIDITERKQAEEALREKTEELERFFLSALDLLCIADTDGYFRRLNREWEKVLGYRLEDLEGRRFLDLVHPDDLQATLGAIAELNAQKEVVDFTNRYRCKEGTYRWIEWRSVPHGKLIYAAARDITERKQADEALQEARSFLQQVVDTSPSMIFVVDSQGRAVFVNQYTAQYYGTTPEELISKSTQDVHRRETEAEEFVSDDQEVIRTRRKIVREELNTAPNGEQHWFHTVKVPLYRSDGTVDVLGISTDITERKRIESALRESEKRYRDLVEFSPVAMTVHVEGRIVYINPAGARLWGADTPDEVLGRSPLEFVHPEYHERITERIEQIQAVEQSPPPIEVKNTRLDGQILYTVGTGIPITYEGKPAILSVVLDITERKLAEERLRELTRQLIAAQEAERKRIAQELHDELGQAMTAISLDLGGIEKALPAEASRELRERLIDARSMADAVDEQISEMALDLRPSLLDDLGLLPALQWYLNRYSQRTGIEVATDFEDLESRLPDEVETTLYRVIQEALTNIARHAQAGKVLISLDRSAAAVTASIQDNGRGFDVDGAQGPVASPGGMGLLGIKDRVSTLGGTVDIHSERGEGTRIQIELPI